MKWNDLTLFFLWIVLSGMVWISWQSRWTEELFYQKLLVDRNLDTIAEDCLYASIEGIREDFEPIINLDYLLSVFEQEKDWIFGVGKVEIPLLFFTEKEQECVYAIHKRKWESYAISGYDRIGDRYAYLDTLNVSEEIRRTDEIQEILTQNLHNEPNLINSGKQYRLSLPYSRQEEGIQKIEKTGIWYLFSSRRYRVNGKEFDFFTYSGARSNRKRSTE